MAEGLHEFDRPNSYIGKSVPRPDIDRLVAGRGRFVDDLNLTRMLHAAFLRSPYAHADILSVDLANARDLPGVRAIYTGADISAHMTPYVGVLTHLAGLRSEEQYPLAMGRVRWQGEPVVMVVAETRAQAEDALGHIAVEYEPREPLTDANAALNTAAPRLHESFDSNLAWERLVEAGEVDVAFADPDNVVVERSFRFGRHTGVTLEARSAVMDFDPSDETLTFHYSGQAPHMMQAILAKHLHMPEANVRIIARDVGGSFGIKIHTYGDEMALAVASKLLRRPVKFVADRMESFLTDIHARDHEVSARMAVSRDGKIQAVDFTDVTGIGPYSMYPRTSAIECNQILNLTAAPYAIENYRARGKVVFQNKNMMCQYRAVGHPVAMAIGDGLLDDAARQIGMDSFAIRELNLIADDSYPMKSASGMAFNDLSHQACLAKLKSIMDWDAMRERHNALRDQNIWRGAGIVSMVEVTNPSPAFYGIGGAPIASQDGATVRLDADGALHISSSVTEQGQGTHTVLAQVAADGLGVDIDDIRVTTGDTATTPYGGGTWASRGAGIGGEAMLHAALALKDQVLDVAASLLQTDAVNLDIRSGKIVDRKDGAERMSLGELGRIVYYRGNELPPHVKPELIATRHYRVTDVPFVFTNGAMGAEIELDPDTGFVTICKFWAVEDCGRVLNPKLVDEQIRGGVVQGIGGALYEECHYAEDGQLMNVSMADYLVPMAGEMPDIEIAHVETPSSTSVLGAKGAGEAGTGGAPAALLNAVNDALSHFDTSVWQMPMTPERILRSMNRIT